MNANYRPAYLVPLNEHDQPVFLRSIIGPYPNSYLQLHDAPEPFSDEVGNVNPASQWEQKKNCNIDNLAEFDESPLHNKAVTGGLYDYDRNPSYIDVRLFLALPDSFRDMKKVLKKCQRQHTNL